MFSPRINHSSDLHIHCLDNRDATDSTRPHACPLPGCTRKFKRRFTLKEHIKTHTGEKSFQCPVTSCHKSFTTSGNLTRHKRTHPWLETTFECLIVGCGCMFTSETKLERHMGMVHFGLSTHVCPHANCGSAFSTAGNLRRHERKYHTVDGVSSPTNPTVFGEQKPTGIQQHHRGICSSAVEDDSFVGLFHVHDDGFLPSEKHDIASPVAVDSFFDSNTNNYAPDQFWSTPPFLEQTLPTAALSPLQNDRDLYDAIGFLFESNPDWPTSAMVQM